MKITKKLISRKNCRRLFAAANSLALFAVINSVSSTCFWDFYQPKMPESARSLAERK